MAVSLSLNMRPFPPANNFCKTARCPSSQSLLRYHRHRLAIADRAGIDIHLRGCDFCSAELQLLMRHRSNADEYRQVEMPGQLRRFAEDLLTRTAIPFAYVGLSNSRQSH